MKITKSRKIILFQNENHQFLQEFLKNDYFVIEKSSKTS
jgi:hypothetical protein